MTPSRCFAEQAWGFRVQHLCRYPVTVELAPWMFVVSSAAQPPQRCGLYEGARLATLIAGNLLGVEGAAADVRNVLSKRVTHVAQSIAADVNRHRWRLLAQVDPDVHGVQRRAGRIAGRMPALAEAALLYQDRYLVRDVLTYRTAAIALAYLESDLWPRRAGEGACADEPSVEALLGAMAQWRGLFSPTGVPYRSLNRTLMNLPEEVPANLVCQLNRIRLERPVTNGLELTMLLLRVSTPEAASPEAVQSQLRIFHHASSGEIESVIRRIARGTSREISLRRLEDLRFVIKYLGDYPEPYRGSLGGLAEQALRWHHHAHERRARERFIVNLGGDAKPTAPPPIALPKIAGITFLSTVGAVVAEGARMKHCIASRATDAVAGRCYLFHIDHQDKRASVEVSAKGEIVDAEGPGNTENLAVQWGAKRLHTWAAALRQLHRPPRRARRVHAEPVEQRQLALPF